MKQLLVTTIGCGKREQTELKYEAQVVALPQIDLGVQEIGATSVYTFSVPNQSGSDVNIVNCHSSCDCIRLETASRFVKADDEAILRCTVDANDAFAGNYAFEVEIRGAPGTSESLSFSLLIRFIDKVASWTPLVEESEK